MLTCPDNDLCSTAFVYIFAIAILTEWKDLSEFNKNEWLGFYIFCIAEAITFFVTMLIANKAGKKILSVEKTEYDVRKRMIETSALLLGNVIKIYSDEGKSGTGIKNRKGYNDMMASARRKEFTKIYCKNGEKKIQYIMV